MALFAGSCQKENLEPEGGNIVTYTVQVPDALSTKAIGTDVSAVTELVYEVYRFDYENNEEDRLYQKTLTRDAADANWTVELELVNNQDFRVLFWAQVPENDVYTTQSLKAVTLSTDLDANTENYAAFAGQTEIKYNKGFKDGNITLVRPVAQLNIATSAESLVLGEGGSVTTTVTFEETSVEVKGLSNVYNVAAEEAVADNDGSAYIYKATDPTSLSEETITVNTKDYTYVSMNYVGFIPKAGDNVDVKYTIVTDNVGTITNEIKNVPVKANYRTNIIGNLITSTSDYTVELSNQWPTEDYKNIEVVSVSTAADLQQAINEIPAGVEGNIKLEGHIDLSTLAGLVSTKSTVPTYGLLIPYGKSLVLDLNGNTLSQTVTQTGAYSMIQNDGVLTIIDGKGTGKISYSDTGNGGNYVSNTIVNNGTLVIEGGLIENNSSANVASNGYPHPIDNNGVLTINGGTLTNNANYSSMRIWCTTDDNTSVTINGGTFNGSIDFQTVSDKPNKGILTINGGTFNPDTYTNSSVRLLGFGSDVDEMFGYIKGGIFNGSVKINKYGSVQELNSQVFYITGGQFSEDPSNFVVDGYPVIAPETEGGYYTIGEYTTVAKIGDQEYGTLRAAVAAAQDGETITLIADETFTKANRYYNNGYWDGLGYSGDKSFTIDLNGHTIKQDGALNDYLMWFKNDGAKPNTITLKNGTMDAGTTAYCALATASSNAQKITVNLENIQLNNNNSYGAVCKIRAGAELNVKAGTKIKGNNSYVGIEAWNAVVNIYDGAEIYQNGNTSYCGSLVGVSGNATANIYGGSGISKKGGFIAMTSGGTINISGGEWIANSNGTYADGNDSVLIAQSENGAKCIINVTGGTFKGGYNCYGAAVGDAQINISGGNFNSDPSKYIVLGYEVKENNGKWVVSKKPEAEVNGVPYVGTLAEAVATAVAGDTITLIDDVTLSENLALPAGIIFNGNGKQINGTIYAGTEGNLTFAGHTKVTAFSASYYNRTITIGKGACLEVTGTGRVTLGYGNTFNITGNIQNAKAADKTNVQPSLIIPGGISITGGNDAAMNVTNAYVKIGNTSSKNNAANGKFSLNFTNAIAEFTNQLTFSEPTSGMNPTFEVTVTNSVLTTGTKFIAAAPGSNVTIDNSEVTLYTYFRNSGSWELKNQSVLLGKTIQFGENGGNDGKTIVDNSSFTIIGGSTEHALDGKKTGSITAKNGATVTVDYYKDLTITRDATSTFTGTEVQ